MEWRAGLVERHRSFMARPVIRQFQRDGGKVFLATEGRCAATIAALIGAGHRCFAEKYVQEVAGKWPGLRGLAPDLRLHGFGRLQTNKIGRACEVFDLLEGVGRDAEIAVLRRLVAAGRSVPPVCIQINCGGEPQKGGFAFADADRALDAMREAGLAVVGAMAIPPVDEDPAPHFRALRAFADRHRLRECVMGMSRDHEVAIDLGATCIRIGRAILAGAMTEGGPGRTRDPRRGFHEAAGRGPGSASL
ncbi:alanine racemase [Microbaculum marinum]|uniref:YggS family pyridoxal phosphate-dependent enzyme n=1 Tax=Microbaculum marinum TaxID=1764581 RepID=A0AAW9RHZ8_9HYPH